MLFIIGVVLLIIGGIMEIKGDYGVENLGKVFVAIGTVLIMIKMFMWLLPLQRMRLKWILGM